MNEFGECIESTNELYTKLKLEGQHPKIIEGYVETANDGGELLPNKKFLRQFKQSEYFKIKQNPYYTDYTPAIEHSWIEINDRIIDPTKDQFMRYGGIIKYYKQRVISSC